MNHSNGQKQNGNVRPGLSPIGRALAPVAPYVQPKSAYNTDYGQHAESLGVGATWLHPDMFQGAVYATA